MTRCPTCHGFRRLWDDDRSVPCTQCTAKPKPTQIQMLSRATERASEFCNLALAVVEGAPFDTTAATTALMDALACTAAAFDDEMTDTMFLDVVRRCGLAPALAGHPANDDAIFGGAA